MAALAALIIGGSARVAAAPGSSTAPAPYVNAKYRFSVTPPAGWVAKQNRDAVIVFVVPVAGQAPVHRRRTGETNREFVQRLMRQDQQPAARSALRADIAITVTKPDRAYTLDEYARVSRRLASRMRGFRILRERAASLDGADAVDRSVRVTMADGTSAMNREVFCMRGGSVFTIALASPPAEYRRDAAVFMRMLESFRWTK